MSDHHMSPSSILEALGIAARGESEPLPSGVSCDAWRVDSDRGPLVVRIERTDRPTAEADAPRFEAQAGILERLAAIDPALALPRHIATNPDTNTDAGVERGAGWSVDTAVEGSTFPLGDGPSAPIAHELGRLLVALHALPVEGFGMLEDRRDLLRGSADDFTAGVLARYADAWPYSGKPLVSHPSARAAPHLVGALGDLRAQLERYAEASTIAVLHGDLHGGHVFASDGTLRGVIDFGSAWAGPPAFDLASVAVMLGWSTLRDVLAGYESNTVLRDVRLAEAEQLAVVVALHRLRRAVEERQSDPARWIGFLEELLPRATRRDA
jgi:aminoglycoside phosphotransferase (APT) family kinase protein